MINSCHLSYNSITYLHKKNGESKIIKENVNSSFSCYTTEIYPIKTRYSQ